VTEPTYYVQFRDPDEEPDRWHTIARVLGRERADEVVRLAEGGYMRTSVTSHYLGRAVSMSALKREKKLAHAEWELGMGPYRQYGRALVEKAEQNLRRPAPAPPPATVGERVAAALAQAGAPTSCSRTCTPRPLWRRPPRSESPRPRSARRFS
jgi:hypothetical protein